MLSLIMFTALLGSPQVNYGPITVKQLVANFEYELYGRKFQVHDGLWVSKLGGNHVDVTHYRERSDGKVDVILTEDDHWTHWVILDENFDQAQYIFLGACDFKSFHGEEAVVACHPEHPVICPNPFEDFDYCYLS